MQEPIKKTVSVYKQTVLCITIPKKIANAMKLEKGSLIQLTYNPDTDEFTGKKVDDKEHEKMVKAVEKLLEDNLGGKKK